MRYRFDYIRSGLPENAAYHDVTTLGEAQHSVCRKVCIQLFSLNKFGAHKHFISELAYEDFNFPSTFLLINDEEKRPAFEV